ncbi:probable tRNA/rRNA methyltransferase (chromatophore) [Paulinella micropora]|uniref:Probable tRNA/rRNA methyltransferase n=1 Tax=Paulinella micropora TaxID=1928728 RepID=A0A1L5YCT7_9EUKA|nr:putative tRNA/rRNA methyltransferase [Paulinella micropora]AQX45284.1 putative tRNA/rRNA methyltransferase [Paulinella micropora]BBL86502.1 probable tRNA/rRNA methyltransferase [Paulinella micropora]
MAKLTTYMDILNRTSSIVIVLVQPAGPLNVGSVARLCANFGIQELRLVAPCCNPLAIGSKQMSVHGLSILKNAIIYPDLFSALADCNNIVACSGRIDSSDFSTYSPAESLSWLLSGPTDCCSAIVFGREDRGLSNDELSLAGRVLKLVTRCEYNSLNLSHAVAIVLYELTQTYQTSIPVKSAQTNKGPATCLELEGFINDAKNLLLKVGFLYPHTSSARMKQVRAFLKRSRICGSEVALLRGMVRHLHWATKDHHSS